MSIKQTNKGNITKPCFLTLIRITMVLLYGILILLTLYRNELQNTSNVCLTMNLLTKKQTNNTYYIKLQRKFSVLFLLRRGQLRKQDLFLSARFTGLALWDKQKTLSMSSKLLHCGCNISIRPSWTLCPVLSFHLVLSDPRFTLNETGVFTASPFVFSATGPHKMIAKFRVH